MSIKVLQIKTIFEPDLNVFNDEVNMFLESLSVDGRLVDVVPVVPSIDGYAAIIKYFEERPRKTEDQSYRQLE